jgi:hypothetical protein
MGFKATLLLIIVFFAFTSSITAQPGCSTMNFNPFDNYFYGDVDFVIYGSAIDSEDLKDWVKFKGGNTYFSESRTKIKVEVSEQLKGQINEKQIEIYIGWDCRGQVGGTAIYKLKKAFIGNNPVWVADQVSYPMNDYSDKGREEILAKVKSDLATNNEHNLSGVVVEKFGDELSYTAADEIQRKLGYHPKNFRPLTGITIEAKRESDGKIFRTNADNQGTFKFTDLAYGNYQIYPVLNKGYERIGVYPNAPPRYQQRYDTVEVRKDWANARFIFKIQQVGNIKGKIENIPLDFANYAIKIWRIDDEGEYTNESSFSSSIYPVSINKTNSIIEFNFPSFSVGKYALAISDLRGTIYFPGVGEKGTAKTFEVKKGETTDVSFKIP